MSWIQNVRRLASRTPWLNSLFSDSNLAKEELVCFFVPEKSRGWILEAVSREIAERITAPYVFCSNYKNLPRAKAYFFCHYHFYLSALQINPHLRDENCVVWFTHPKEVDLGGRNTIEALNSAKIVTMCTKWKRHLVELGVKEDRVTTIIGGADLDLFPPHQRGGGKIGFCTAYYDRKSPDRIFEIVRLLPECNFVLMGRNWNEYSRFSELVGLKNLEYRESTYDQYPAFYAELDVFVSASQLEGGPIPLLESMLSNVVPVASDTGFAPDIINSGENGFLFSAEEPDPRVIVELIIQAKQLKADIRQSVVQYGWENYAKCHEQLFRAA